MKDHLAGRSRSHVAALALLLLTVSASSAEPEPRAVLVELADGSRIHGKAGLDTIQIVTSYARMDLPAPEIATVTYGKDGSAATVKFKNGDIVVGAIDLGAVKVATLGGELSLGTGCVDTIHLDIGGVVATNNGFREAAGFAGLKGATRLALTLTDDSCIQTYSTNATIRIKTSYAEVDLKLDQLSTLAPEGGNGGMLAQLANGDRLHCSLITDEFIALSLAGRISVKAEHIRSIKVLPAPGG